MKPVSFDYVRAESVDEVLGVLRERGGEARILAGGQSLLPMLNMRLARPRVVVDIMRIRPLAVTAFERDAIIIPAGVRQADMLAKPGLADDVPLLAAALPWVGHFQTRSRGTICGSVAHADPSAEIPLCLVALEGEVRLRAKRKRRSVAAQAFFTGMMVTDKADDEMIEAVVCPKRRVGAGYAFTEVGRRHGDFAIVACAAVVTRGSTRLAVGGVADRPVARDLGDVSGGALEVALDAFAYDLDAREDMHATARFRRDLVRRLGRATIAEAQLCLG